MRFGYLQPAKVHCWRINSDGDKIPMTVSEGKGLVFVPPGYDKPEDPAYIAVVEDGDYENMVGIMAWSAGVVVEFVEE